MILFWEAFYPIMHKTPHKIFSRQSRLLLLVGCVAAVLGGSAFFPCSRNRTVRFDDHAVQLYDDRTEKDEPGASEILSVTKDASELKMSYILRPGFSYPYAGVLLHLTDSSGATYDCSRYRTLKIRIASSRLSDCKIYLKLFDAKVSKVNSPLSERYLKKDLVLSPVPTTIAIPFNQFTTPEWWFQRNNITLKDVAPLDFSKVMALQVESGSTAKTGIVDTITISQIRFTNGPNRHAFGALLLVTIGTLVVIIFRLLPRKKKAQVIITYDKTEVQNYRDIDVQRLSTYVAEHFSEPELTILTVGKALGLTQKKIAKVMLNAFTMSFKQYLTAIRIHEAKRLLRETDRLVIDISLTVGFNNISHFNRVFKTVTNMTPLAFRHKKGVDSSKMGSTV